MFVFFKERVFWSWGGLFVILSSLWGMTQITVKLSYWRRDFFNMIQQILNHGGDLAMVMDGLKEFGILAAIFVVVAVCTDYLTQRWLLSWRESVMMFYDQHWDKLRLVEGASQRMQEDCKLFTKLLEGLGEGAIRAIMILIAFSPILWELSAAIPDLLFMNVQGGLTWIAMIWAIGGTIVLLWIGRKLPGLEFKNQKAEAALRKEYVLGEDNVAFAQHNKVIELWRGVRHNYLMLYLQYLHFGLGKWTYLQFSVIVPLIVMSPSIASGAITFGILMQTIDAFGNVESSMQYLLRSWSSIVDFISVYKRLQQFQHQL